MLVRCACGKLTNFGLLCVNCARDRQAVEDIDLDEISIDDLLEEEDED
jgi:hypothetical protein